jgi:LDH2 family malate/lactate/ureidoglycolate dehydrogenase
MVSIPRYAVRIASGKLNSRPQIRIERETANTVQIDGDNGPGQWVSTVAMEAAIRKAREQGVGMVSVRRSNHFGAAGHYVWQATKNGLIGLCTTNGPLILAPTGGITPTFGNNPLGVGIPAGRHFPILLDIAMSVAPRGKIGLAVAEGKPLPPGWILDRLGRPSTDLADLAAGLGMPIGGHKGYGLALVLEVLAGVLSGAGFSADHSRDKLHGSSRGPDYGHFFIAIDPERFMPASEFTARVDRMIEQTKSGEHAENVDEILIPGEMELRARAQSLKEGVRLRPSTYRALVTYGRQMGLGAELNLVSSEKVPAG